MAGLASHSRERSSRSGHKLPVAKSVSCLPFSHKGLLLNEGVHRVAE